MVNFFKGIAHPGIKALLVLLVVALLGCVFWDRLFPGRTMIASINPYNFTDVSIVDLYVNGTWGGNSYAHSGGGTSVCCISVPVKWNPDFTVKIKWKKTEDSKLYSAEAKIPRYVESAGLQVLFMGNDEIKVYLIDYWPCSSMHPMPKSDKLCGENKKS